MAPGAGPGGRRGRATRRAWWLGLGVAGLLLGAAYAEVASLAPRPVPPGWPPASDLAEYTAVLHVHSAYSHDGRGTVAEVAAAAARAGARVVFLTDHNTLAPLADDRERWYGGTLVLVGAEVTTGNGYLLVLNPRRDSPVEARGFELGNLVEHYRSTGAIVILAHPEHPRLGWRGELPPVDGIEVVDVFDQVVAAPIARQALGLLAYPANPAMAVLSVVHWAEGVLGRWDRMSRERPTIGVLGLDAHGGIALTEGTVLRFPSHETAFRFGQLHFVTAEGLRHDAADRTRVYRAMAAGQFYNAFDGLAKAAGFRFGMRRGSERIPMGGETTTAPDLALEVWVPPVTGAVLRVLRDGEVVHEGEAGGVVRLPVAGPGVYRAEVDLRVSLFPISTTRRVPWIFSNPIRVRP